MLFTGVLIGLELREFDRMCSIRLQNSKDSLKAYFENVNIMAITYLQSLKRV